LQISDLKPKNVFRLFSEISSIPRESNNEEQIANYIVDFAKKNNLEYIKDDFNNVLIKKKANSLANGVPTIILQAHMDMVCVKTNESQHDFKKDPIDIIVSGDYIRALDTSLGADNGIGLAIALAVLEEKNISHPNLEVLLTSGEEVGMIGAKNFDKDKLEGQYMINLDNSNFGQFCVGCAGSTILKAYIPIELEENKAEISFHLTISGLTSGHSGDEIQDGHANAIILMARFLYKIDKVAKIYLYNVSGGTKANLIPNSSSIEFGIRFCDLKILKNAVLDIEKEFRDEFVDVEPNIKLKLSEFKSDFALAFSQITLKALIKKLLFIPNGVIEIDVITKNLVNTSNNLAIVEMREQKVVIYSMVRSISDIRKNFFIDKLSLLFHEDIKIVSDSYPWVYNNKSKLINFMRSIYIQMYNSDPNITTIHAGLECSYFSDKICDIVSIGADIFGMHTTSERCQIKSVENLWNFICRILHDMSLSYLL
jgi:dipeptidase D